MTPTQRPRRLGRLAAVTAVAALALSACSVTSPRQTTVTYPPSDGTAASIELPDGGSVSLHNMLVVADAQGGPGRVIGAVEVTGDEPVTVELTGDFGDAEPPAPLTVEAVPGALTILGEGGEDVVLPSVAAAPGAFLQMTARTAAGGSVQWAVPVMAPNPPYEGLAPTEAPAPAATATP